MPLCSETLHNCFCSAAGPPCINVYKRAQRSAKRTSVLFFPPKKIQRCRAEGRSVRYGSVWDGSNPPSPPGRGPAGTARSTAPRRTATRSVPPVTAQLRPRPPQQRSPHRCAPRGARIPSTARTSLRHGTARYSTLSRFRSRSQPQLRRASRTAPPRRGAARGGAELCRTEPSRDPPGAPLPAPLLPRPGSGVTSEPGLCPMSRFYFKISETSSP